MKDSYKDIRERISEEPSWFDHNGTPRYNEPLPGNSPNVYARTVVFMRVGCQSCREEFIVELNSYDREEIIPEKLGYGDPPYHGCVGDTMISVPRLLIASWTKEAGKSWARIHTDVPLKPDWWHE